ncbi:MAG: hemerythrin domain-containing protein [Deltaproteobacteria bacterium]|nr:hemerythrin domain-containing protein [Deltaproteobacteria bacterium]
MKATDLLRADHESIRRLLAQIERPGPGPAETAELRSTIRRELEIHAQIEERLFYPVVERLGSDAAKLVAEALGEHGAIRLLCDRLETMALDGHSFRRELAHLRDKVEWHVAREEHELFDLAEDRIGVDELEELGVEIEELEVALLTGPGTGLQGEL